MSNFAFLKAEWPELRDAASKAEALAYPDSRAACFYARRGRVAKSDQPGRGGDDLLHRAAVPPRGWDKSVSSRVGGAWQPEYFIAEKPPAAKPLPRGLE
jgi:hypothetical protein